ncbi:MAG: GH116 family glycosyl-hydrolase, partial [Verrucomicrobiota bacterium]
MQMQNIDAYTVTQNNIHNSGIPLGGIGTGGVELWPDGRFYKWDMLNARPWAGSGQRPGRQHLIPPVVPEVMDTDFFIRVKAKGSRPVYRWLFTGHGLSLNTASHFWRHHKFFFIKAYQEIRYTGQFPFAKLEYVDPEFPLAVKLAAWSPFVPHDVENSSLPGFFLDFEVENRGKEELDVSLVWQMQNLAGYAAENNTQSHEAFDEADATMIRMRGSLADPENDSSGDMTIWAEASPGQEITRVAANPYMQNLIWSIHTQGNLEGPLMPERLQREELNETPPSDVPNKGWLCLQQTVSRHGEAAFHLGLGWFFPNHRTINGTRIGHEYENRFADSLEVARHLVEKRGDLHARSRLLGERLESSTLPPALAVSLHDQMTTLIKNSHFSKDGRIGVQEGHGCCAFNTMDVDHYSSYALSLLQPALRRKIMEMQTQLVHPVSGKIHHGLPGSIEPLQVTEEIEQDGFNRWDCSCQYVIQAYRDALWAGDRELLEHCFPHMDKAMKLVASLDFYGVGLPYIQGGITYDHWNMEGVVNYMAGVYLAALKALAEAARILGEAETEAWAEETLRKGLAGYDRVLWNGEQYLLYYSRRPRGREADVGKGEHKLYAPVLPPEECRAPELDDEHCGANCACHRGDKPYVEIGDTGMMTDLLNGNGTAEVIGVGAFLEPDRVRGQLRKIFERNFQEENLALVNGSYPDEHFLDEFPFAQWQTPWTGTEYHYAMQCYAAGLTEIGDRVIAAVLERHVREGMRWDHGECNNHYSR